MAIDLAKALTLPAYPRSAVYDSQWQIDTMMGPNVLWLTESVTNRMRLEPGMRVWELDAIPDHLAPYWEPDFWSFHSASWWRRHLERTGPFAVVYAGNIPDAIAYWLHWERTVSEVGYPPHFPHSEKDIPFLEDDMGTALALVELVARKP